MTKDEFKEFVASMASVEEPLIYRGGDAITYAKLDSELRPFDPILADLFRTAGVHIRSALAYAKSRTERRE